MSKNIHRFDEGAKTQLFAQQCLALQTVAKLIGSAPIGEINAPVWGQY